MKQLKQKAFSERKTPTPYYNTKKRLSTICEKSVGFF